MVNRRLKIIVNTYLLYEYSTPNYRALKFSSILFIVVTANIGDTHQTCLGRVRSKQTVRGVPYIQRGTLL